MEYHGRTKAKKPKADPKSISSSCTLAGQSGDRKRKRKGARTAIISANFEGGDRMQQQAAGRAANVEDKRKAGRAGDVADKRKAGRARAGDVDVEDKRKAGRAGNLTHSAAARRRHGHDDDVSPDEAEQGQNNCAEDGR